MVKKELHESMGGVAGSRDELSELLDVTVSSENVCLDAVKEMAELRNTPPTERTSYMMEAAIRSQNKKLMRDAVHKFDLMRRERGARALKPGLFLATVPAYRARLERRTPNDDEIEQTASRLSDYLVKTAKEYSGLLNIDRGDRQGRDRRGITQGAIGEAAVVYSSFLFRSITGEEALSTLAL
jgi:hypothetical protein